jgi:hypothetical protein
VNRFFEIVVPFVVSTEVNDIFGDIINYTENEEAAHVWLKGFFNALQTLERTPYHQICERETEISGFLVRRILHRQKEVRREYHAYYTIYEYPIPDPEPTNSYPAGRVLVLFVRHAAQKPLTKKELGERLKAAISEVAQIDDLLTQDKES